ncbi:hypothetical protein ACNVED_07795 [Legionella sp. D16C41]|uniref:hypothetical protein n=1 Tax=Legionella sp. D16C41 TaxID=3402688 RepID=UPI003AF5F01D
MKDIKKIILIAFNLLHNPTFEKLSFDDQLAVLGIATINTYKAVKKARPDAYVIVAWRERGLCNQLALSQENVDKLIDILGRITQQKDLLIIAGSIISQKKVIVSEKQDKLMEVKDAYNQYQFVETLEKAKNYSFSFLDHKNQFNLISKEAQFFKIKHTSLFFKDGAKVYRRHKIAPWEEIPRNVEKPHAYTLKKQELIYTLDEENHKTIGVEMCFEHNLGLMQHAVKNQMIPAPTIHLIIADSNTLMPEHACGDYTVRIDSDPDDSINFGMKPNANNEFLEVYQVNPYQYQNPVFVKIVPQIYNSMENLVAEAPGRQDGVELKL